METVPLSGGSSLAVSFGEVQLLASHGLVEIYFYVIDRVRAMDQTPNHLSTIISVESGSHGPDLARSDGDLKLSHTYGKSGWRSSLI